MRIPRWMLRQQVMIRPLTGSGAYGAQYGEAFTARCRIEPRTQTIQDRQGNETVASAKAYFAPGVTIPVGSELVWADTRLDVIDVKPKAGPNGRTHHIEVWLR